MLNTTRLHAVIIDLDGTMVDTVGDFVAALNATLAELRLRTRIDEAFVKRMVGKGSEDLIRSTLLHVKASPNLFDAACAHYQQHYERINGTHAEVYAGVTEGLVRMRQHGLKVACLTNKPSAFTRELLRQKELDSYFTVVFGGDAFKRLKPDPLPVLRTCEALLSDPARTLIVGDSSNDALAARGAGCPVVLVTYGYNHGEPVRNVDADAFIDRLDALVFE